MVITKFAPVLIVLLFSLTFVSADNWCYDNSEKYGSVKAYAQICGTEPRCEGIQEGSYCIGKWYAEISHTGDKFYLARGINEWPEDIDDSGYHESYLSNTYDQRLYFNPTSDGRIKGYYLCAWDYDEANDDWAWAGQCGGYLVTWFGGNYFLADCQENSEICSGNQLSRCENHKWVNKGLVDGKCNYKKPFCGDGSCYNDETCENCEADCGKCKFDLIEWIKEFFEKVKEKLGLGAFSRNSITSQDNCGGKGENAK